MPVEDPDTRADGDQTTSKAFRAAQVRVLSMGSSVFEQERIRAGAESVAQLLFIDQTTLSVGPRSEVTLDRFVYDALRNTGDVLLFPGVLPTETWEQELADDSTIRLEELFDHPLIDDPNNCDDSCDCNPQFCEGLADIPR